MSAFKPAKRGDLAIVKREHSATYVNGSQETYYTLEAGKVASTREGRVLAIVTREGRRIAVDPRDHVRVAQLTIPASKALELLPAELDSIEQARDVLVAFKREGE